MVQKNLVSKNIKKNKMSLRKNYHEALELKYKAQMAEAKANLELYLSPKNLAAIGEHSDLLEEQDKWLTRWVDAKDKLEGLQNFES